MKMKPVIKLIIALLIMAVIGVILFAVRSGGSRKETEDAGRFDSHDDIFHSAVHSDLPVGMVLPAEIEETTDEDTDAAGADSGPDASGNDGEIDIYQLDVWDLALYLYGIDYLTTTRMLKLITREEYPDDYLLNYYCACACVTRALYPEDFGGTNIYQRFGGRDDSYDLWMDNLEIGDWAYGSLRDALLDFQYIDQCNSMAEPWNYIYYSEMYGIYVWNPEGE